MPKPGPQHPRVWRCACGCANGWWRSACFRCGGTVAEPGVRTGAHAPRARGDEPAASGSATVSHDPPVLTSAVPPATPIPARAQGAATLVAGDAGGPSQQAEGGVPPGTTAPPPAAGIASLLPPEVQAQIAGDHVIPSGKYKGKTISEVDDARWFASMLAAKPSPTKTAVETYANSHPDLVSS